MAIRSLKSGSFSRSTQVGNSIILPGDYESIATTTVGAGGTSSITFSSIPNTFTHLQIRAITNTTKASASGADSIELTLNSDATASYSAHRLFGDGSGTTADGFANLNYSYIGVMPQTVSSVSYYYAMVLDILDYANTNKYKTIRSLSGFDANGSGRAGLFSGSWRSTNAVSSITFYPDNRSALFTQYSHFALYGIRG